MDIDDGVKLWWGVRKKSEGKHEGQAEGDGEREREKEEGGVRVAWVIVECGRSRGSRRAQLSGRL